MNIIKHISGSLETVNKTFKRFPGTILFCLLVAAAVIYKTEAARMLTAQQNDVMGRIILSFMLGIPLSLCAALLLERIGISGRVRGLVSQLFGYALTVTLIVFYYYVLLPDNGQIIMVRYGIVNAVLYVTALIIPYTIKRENFEVFGSVLLGRACLTALYGVVIGLGLTAVVFAIDKLLVTNMNTNYYIYIWLTVATVFSPFFFLSGAPQQGETIKKEDYPKLLRILLVYVIMPLLSAYTVVLLIYFGQIIALQRWPKGIISFLVLYYSGISCAVLFLVLPFRGINKWVRLFCFLLPKIILLPLGMMFAAIGMRVGDYGITESRYYILLLGLWALAAFIYFSFTARRTAILPVSLAAILFLSVFGPWDAFNVSRTSQSVRLYSYLEKNNMLKDGSVIPKLDIPEKDKNEISSILSYMENVHKLKDLRYFPANFKVADMQKVLGFGYIQVPDKAAGDYFFYGSTGSPVADISGYEAMVSIYDYYLYKDGSPGKTLEISGYKITVDAQSNLIKVSDGGKQVYQFDLGAYADRMYKKYGNVQNGPDVLDYIVEEQSGRINARLIFKSIGGNYISSENRYDITTVDMIMLLKSK